MAKDHDNEKIYDIVTKTIATVLHCPVDQLSVHSSLSSDLSIDSLLMYEIVIELEEKFDARITDDDIDRVETIGDVVALLDSH